jgi:hypothetical protein
MPDGQKSKIGKGVSIFDPGAQLLSVLGRGSSCAPAREHSEILVAHKNNRLRSLEYRIIRVSMGENTTSSIQNAVRKGE